MANGSSILKPKAVLPGNGDVDPMERVDEDQLRAYLERFEATGACLPDHCLAHHRPS